MTEKYGPVILGKKVDTHKKCLFMLSQTLIDALRQGLVEDFFKDLRDDGFSDEDIQTIQKIAYDPTSFFKEIHHANNPK